MHETDSEKGKRNMQLFFTLSNSLTYMNDNFIEFFFGSKILTFPNMADMKIYVDLLILNFIFVHLFAFYAIYLVNIKLQNLNVKEIFFLLPLVLLVSKNFYLFSVFIECMVCLCIYVCASVYHNHMKQIH